MNEVNAVKEKLPLWFYISSGLIWLIIIGIFIGVGFLINDLITYLNEFMLVND